MGSTDYLGRTCVDIITGFKGICIAYDECLYGCSSVVLQPVSDDAKTISEPKELLTTRVRIIDETIIEGVEIPEYTPPRFWGSLCEDKITRFRGICCERRISLFNADQYVLVAKFNEHSLITREDYLFIDEGRIIELETADGRIDYKDEKQKAVSADEVMSSRSGGMYDYSRLDNEVSATLKVNANPTNQRI